MTPLNIEFQGFQYFARVKSRLGDYYTTPIAFPGLVMTPGQRAAAEALLQFSLSEVGYQKAHNLMHLETVVRQLDRFVFSCLLVISLLTSAFCYTMFGIKTRRALKKW